MLKNIFYYSPTDMDTRKLLCWIFITLYSCGAIFTSTDGLITSFGHVVEFSPSIKEDAILEKKGADLFYYGDDIEGVGVCGRLAGCKTLYARKGCGSSGMGNACKKCMQHERVSEMNVMLTSYYKFDRSFLKACTTPGDHGCPNIPYVNEMVEFMTLEEESDIPYTFQAALFKNANVPRIADLNAHYTSRFCGRECYEALQTACSHAYVLPKVRYWCHTSLSLVREELKNLRGPASYVLFLTARLVSYTDDLEPLDATAVRCKNESKTGSAYVNCTWPSGKKLSMRVEKEEKAALVAAAAVSVMLTGKWFEDSRFDVFDLRFNEFGFAVQHSLWLALFVGRMRISLLPVSSKIRDLQIQQHPHSSFVPGTFTTCGPEALEVARNSDTSVGSVYTSLCALFNSNPKSARKIRFRPEIHVRNGAALCVEKAVGLAFLRPGDWFRGDTVEYTILNRDVIPSGLAFTDREKNLTTLEMTSSRGNFLFPASVEEILRDSLDTTCTRAKGEGPNEEGLLGKAGLLGVGGLCSWVPVF